MGNPFLISFLNFPTYNFLQFLVQLRTNFTTAATPSPSPSSTTTTIATDLDGGDRGGDGSASPDPAAKTTNGVGIGKQDKTNS